MRQRDRLLQVALEGQVDVARRQHQPAVDAAGGREGQRQPAGPVRHGAGAAGVAPVAAGHGALQRDREVGPGRRGHAHLAGRAQALDVLLHEQLQRAIVRRRQPRQGLGVLVAHVQHAGAALEDGRQFRRMHQPFDRAVDHQRAAGQRGHHRRHVLQRVGRAGGAGLRAAAHKHGGHHQAEDPRPQAGRGQPGQLHQHRAALAFAEHGDRVAGLDGAAPQHGLEGVQPGRFDSFLQHGSGVLVHTT